ncbi:sulfatase-like hydrolase/transferase [Paenibacillus sp. CC-CFT747]|nr:sulfatase-like hydrolase/transferase [Paenibacillus sp. CC-CFT747]
MAEKPNVILITTDQQRYDSVGMSGSSFVKTPNMDRLGREGAFFRRAYCPNTVCSPSRASIMTGLHLSRHGAYNIGTAALDPSRFLSHELRRAGYRTYHVGKAHWYPWGTVNPETAPIGEDGAPLRDFVGFDAAEVSIGHAGPGGITGHYAYWMRSKGYDPVVFQAHKRFDKDDNGTSDYELPVSLHSGTWVAERAVHYLEKHDRTQPFYLNLGFPDPHHPHMVPMDFKDRVDPEAIPYPDIPEPVGEEDPRLPEHIPHFRKGTINDSRFRGDSGWRATRIPLGPIISATGRKAWEPGPTTILSFS